MREIYVGKYLSTESGNAIVESEGSQENKTIPQIYASWNQMMWKGINFNNEGFRENSGEEIFPEISYNAISEVICVENWEELVTGINRNPNATFVIMNDISVPSSGKVFTRPSVVLTGKIVSSRDINGNYLQHSFIISDDNVYNIFGDQVSGATFESINIKLKNDITINENNDCVGLLFGIASGNKTTTINNVHIISADSDSKNVTISNANNAGLVAGKGKNISIFNTKDSAMIENINLVINSETTQANLGYYYGLVMGYMQGSNSPATNVKVENSNLTVSLELNHDSIELGAGGLFGYVESAGQLANLESNNSNVSVTVSGSKKFNGEEVDGKTLAGINVGGIAGISKAFASLVRVNDSDSDSDITLINQTTSNYNIGGAFGITNKKTGVSVYDNLNDAIVSDNVKIDISNIESVEEISIGGVVGNVYKANGIRNIYSMAEINADIKGTTAYIGGVIGYESLISELENIGIASSTITLQGNITNKYIGGMAAHANGTIIKNSVIGYFNSLGTEYKGLIIDDNITTSSTLSYIGGVIGCAENNELNNVVVSDVDLITDADCVGGAIGYAKSYVKLYQVGVYGAFESKGTYLGGLVGTGSIAKMEQCLSDVELTSTKSSGEAHIGGLIGKLQLTNPIVVQTCIALGSITSEYANANCGGLFGSILGSNGADFKNTFTTIRLSAETLKANAEEYIKNPTTVNKGAVVGKIEAGLDEDFINRLKNVRYNADFMPLNNGYGYAMGVEELLKGTEEFVKNDLSEGFIDYNTGNQIEMNPYLTIIKLNEIDYNAYPLLNWVLENEVFASSIYAEGSNSVPKVVDGSNIDWSLKSYFVNDVNINSGSTTSLEDTIIYLNPELSLSITQGFTSIDDSSIIVGTNIAELNNNTFVSENNGIISDLTDNSHVLPVATNNGILVNIKNANYYVNDITNNGIIEYSQIKINAEITGSNGLIYNTKLTSKFDGIDVTTNNQKLLDSYIINYDASNEVEGSYYYKNDGSPLTFNSYEEALDIYNYYIKDNTNSYELDFDETFTIIKTDGLESDVKKEYLNFGMPVLQWELNEYYPSNSLVAEDFDRLGRWYYKHIDSQNYSLTEENREYAVSEEFLWSYSRDGYQAFVEFIKNQISDGKLEIEINITSASEFGTVSYILNNLESIWDITSAVGLQGKVINDYNFKISLVVTPDAAGNYNGLDFSGKISTPINANISSIVGSTIDKEDITITNMSVIEKDYAGVFGEVNVKENLSVSKFRIINSNFLTYGNNAVAGAYVAKVNGVGTLNEELISTYNVFAGDDNKNVYVAGSTAGGLFGSINNLAVNMQYSDSLVGVLGTTSGGAIGEINNAKTFNGSDSQGNTIVYNVRFDQFASSNKYIYGNTFAGGFVGKINTTNAALHISDSYVSNGNNHDGTNEKANESRIETSGSKGAFAGKFDGVCNISSSYISIKEVKLFGTQTSGSIKVAKGFIDPTEKVEELSFYAIDGALNDDVFIDDSALADKSGSDYDNELKNQIDLNKYVHKVYNDNNYDGGYPQESTDPESLRSADQRNLKETTSLAGFSFGDIWISGSESQNNGYPILMFDADYWIDFAIIPGTSDQPESPADEENYESFLTRKIAISAIFEEGYYEGNSTISISTPYELAWVARMVNIGGKDFAGKTINISADIDLEGKIWSAIGYNYDDSSDNVAFKGIISGNNKIISNMTAHSYLKIYRDISNASCTDYSSAFIGYANGTEISKITFNDSIIRGEKYVATVVGIVEDSTISDITVNSSRLIGVKNTVTDQYIGGVVGYYVNNSEHTISNIESNAIIVGNGNYVGGVFGKLENSELTTLENIYTGSSSYINVNNQVNFVGGIAGWANKVKVESNEIKSGISNSATIKATYITTIANPDGTTNQETRGSSYVGGLFGKVISFNYQVIDTDHQSTLNTGAITGIKFVGGVAGNAESVQILGRVSSENNSNEYTLNYACVTNNGNITANQYVGGLIGVIGEVTNSAGTITVVHSDDSNLYLVQNDGKLTIDNYAGGIVGYNSSAIIRGAKNNNDLSTQPGVAEANIHDIGGIAGYSAKSIYEVSNYNLIPSVGSNLGGIVGNLDDKSEVVNAESRVINSIAGNPSATVIMAYSKDTSSERKIGSGSLTFEALAQESSTWTYNATERKYEICQWALPINHYSDSDNDIKINDYLSVNAGTTYSIANATDYLTLNKFISKRITQECGEFDVEITDEIDLSSVKDFKVKNSGSNSGLAPFGSENFSFKGNFNGNNNQITIGKILTFDSINSGFIGKIEGAKNGTNFVAGKITDLDLIYNVGEYIAENAQYNGILVGSINTGTIINVDVKFNGNLTISANTSTDEKYFGNLIGKAKNLELEQPTSRNNDGIGISSDSSITISNANTLNIGGVIGLLEGENKLNINSSILTNISKISAKSVGGFVGEITKEELSGNVATINVESYTNTIELIANDFAGGFAGKVSSGIVNLKVIENEAQINAINSAGGIIGNLAGGSINFKRDILNSSDIKGNSAGGIIGEITSGSVSVDSGASLKNEGYIGDGVTESQTKNAGGFAGSISGATSLNLSTFINSGSIVANKNDASNHSYAGYIAGYLSTTSNITIAYNDSGAGGLSTTVQATYVGGMFGYVGANSEIIDGTELIGSVTISGSISTSGTMTAQKAVGGIIGKVGGSAGSVSIENSTNEQNISINQANGNAGGIIGEVSADNNELIVNVGANGKKVINKGNIEVKDASGALTGNAGGIIGYVGKGTVNLSYVDNENRSGTDLTIISGSVIGGLVGTSNGVVNISNAKNNVSVSANATIGGFIAEVPGGEVTIGSNCFNDATITIETTGSLPAGGLIGFVYNNGSCNINAGAISSLGTVKGDANIGGLIGAVGATGGSAGNASISVTGTLDIYVVGNSYVGGLIGSVYSADSVVKINSSADIDGSLTIMGYVKPKDASAEYGGGLIGNIVEGATVEIGNASKAINNEAQIKDADANIAFKSTGGAIGYLNGNLTMQNVVNKSVINASNITNAGGLIGLVDGGDSNISGTNNGEIDSTQNAGGLIGKIALSASTDSITLAGENKVDIGQTRGIFSGGIVGRTEIIAGTLNISSEGGSSKLTNAGNVKGTYSGGIFGYLESSSDISISGCSNSKIIIGYHAGGVSGLVKSTGGTISIGGSNGGTIGDNSTTMYAGGLVGFALADGGNIALTSGMNSSSDIITNNGENTSVGGVLGYADALSGSITLSSSQNTADFTGSGRAEFIGGVLGHANVRGGSLVFDGAENTGKIEATTSTGGIVGVINMSSGSVQIGVDGSINQTKNEGEITAGENAGGIAGGIAGIVEITGGTMTVAKNASGTSFISNSGNVTGSNAGGIFGKVISSSNIELSDVSNSKEIKAINNGNAGGIIGYIEAKGSELKVGGSNSGTIGGENTKYAGGMIGYSKSNGGNVNLTSGTNASSNISTNKETDSSVGGVLGYAEVNSGNIILSGATNNASFTTKIAENVGGVLGYANIIGGSLVLNGATNGSSSVIQGAGSENNAGIIAKVDIGSNSNAKLQVGSGDTKNEGTIIGTNNVSGVFGTVNVNNNNDLGSLADGYTSAGAITNAGKVIATDTTNGVAAGVFSVINGSGSYIIDNVGTSTGSEIAGAKSAGGIIGEFTTGSVTLGSGIQLTGGVGTAEYDKNKNGTIESTEKYTSNNAGGLTGSVTGGTLNINGQGGSATGINTAGGMIGYVDGGTINIGQSNTIEGAVGGSVTATEDSYTGVDINKNGKAGGLIGNLSGGSVKIGKSGCVVTNNSAVNAFYAGGIIGYTNATNTNLDYVTNNGDVGTSTSTYAGGIVGYALGDVTLGNQSVTPSATVEPTVLNTGSVGNSNSEFVGGLISCIDANGKTATINKSCAVELADSNKITSKSTAGGLIGSVDAGTANINCAGGGNIEVSENAGGMIGKVSQESGKTTNINIGQNNNITGGEGSIKATSIVSGSEGKAGGLIGNLSGGSVKIGKSGCVVANNSTVNAFYAGGIIGYTNATNTNLNYVTNNGNIGTSTSTYAGGIIGYATGKVELSNATSNSEISIGDSSHTTYSGGLISFLSGTNSIINASCSSLSTISGTNAGGFVGQVGGGSVEIKASSSATISSGEDVGGFIGLISDGTATIDANVTGGSLTGFNVGGFVGHIVDSGKLILSGERSSFATISGINRELAAAGGIVGYVETSSFSVTFGTKTTNNGNVDAYYAGGIIGYTEAENTSIDSILTNNGKIGTFDEVDYYARYAGGIIGYADYSATLGNSGTTVTIKNNGSVGNSSSEVVGGLISLIERSDYSITINKSCAVALTATIKSGTTAGGLIGSVKNGTLNVHCNGSGNVEAELNAGGMIGLVESGTVNIAQSNSITGGSGTISATEDSYTGSNKTKNGKAGGLIGNLSGGSVKIGTSSNNVTNNCTVNGYYAGGIIGYTNASSTTLSNVTNAGSVGRTSTSEYASGIIGYAPGKVTLSNAVSNKHISGTTNPVYIGHSDYTTYAGGLISFSSGTDSSIAATCSSSSTVAGTNAGGFVGQVNGGSIEISASPSAGLSGTNVGGTIGEVSGGTATIKANSSVSISSGENVGGFIGLLSGGTATFSGEIEFTGEITGGLNAGGIVGYCSGGSIDFDETVTSKLTNNGTVNGTNAGGFTGKIDAAIILSNVHNGTSGKIGYTATTTNAGGLVGLVELTGTGTSAEKLIINMSCSVDGNIGHESYATSSGGFIGQMATGGIVEINSESEGTIAAKSSGSAGGMIGEVSGGTATIKANSSVSLSSGKNVGGFIGLLSGGTATFSGEREFAGEITSGSNAGGIIGYCSGGSIDFDETVTSKLTNNGTVNGTYAGGIIGYTSIGMTLTNVSNKKTVGSASSTYSGGIIGLVDASGKTIEIDQATNNSSVTAILSGDGSSGGVVGRISNATNVIIKNTTVSDLSKTITAFYAGGIVGRSYSKTEMTNVSNSATVGTYNTTGTRYAGGIIGVKGGGNLTLTNADNSGTVRAYGSGKVWAGGLIGSASVETSTVTINSACSNTGYVYSYTTANTSLSTSASNYSRAGGLIGEVSSGTININCSGGGNVGYYENASGGETIVSNLAGGMIGLVSKSTTNNTQVNIGQSNKIEGSTGNVKTTGVGDCAGGLIGWLNSNTTVKIGTSSYTVENSCLVSGESAGGIIGWVSSSNTLTVTNIENDGYVIGYNDSGGIIGYLAESLTLSDVCSLGGKTIGNTTSTINAGGLIGRVNASGKTITINSGSSNASAVNAKSSDSNSCSGGIVGYVQAGTLKIIGTSTSDMITQNGSVSGYYAGGIVGFVQAETTLEIKFAKNNNSVTGELYAGGLIPCIDDSNVTLNSIENCGAVTAESSDEVTTAGGIVGRIERSSTSTTINISGVANSGNITSSAGSEYQAFAGGIIAYIDYKGAITFRDVSQNSSVTCVSMKSGSSNAFVGGFFGYIMDTKITLSESESSKNTLAGSITGYAPTRVYLGAHWAFMDTSSYEVDGGTESSFAGSNLTTVETLTFSNQHTISGSKPTGSTRFNGARYVVNAETRIYNYSKGVLNNASYLSIYTSNENLTKAVFKSTSPVWGYLADSDWN